ncbi:hypothetical protein SEUCBS140593_003211 [Sporothrix eucalyptigena]|uniref:Uncharacterized protein n=1 Tax=Sporothrix eucalyptigena TaxID=1812306 RepID=A0ABP0BD52_9PEZI
MAKKRKVEKQNSVKDGKAIPESTLGPLPTTTEGVRDDAVLGFKIRALLYDLKNIGQDAAVKAAPVNVGLSDHMDPTGASCTHNYEAEEIFEEEGSSLSLSARLRNQLLDAAIRAMLANFLESSKQTAMYGHAAHTIWHLSAQPYLASS